MDGLRRQTVGYPMHPEDGLKQYVQSENSRTTSEVVERNFDAEDEDSDPESMSYSSEEEDRGSSAFLNLDHVHSFMSSGDTLPNRRDRLKSFLEPKPAKEKEFPIIERSIQFPKNDSATQSEVAEDINEERSYGRIDSSHVQWNYLANIQDLGNPSEVKQLEPEPDQMMSTEQETNMDLASEPCNNGIEIYFLEQILRGFRAKLSGFISGIIYRSTSLFLDPAIPAGAHRLRWSCKCGHMSYDDFMQLSIDGLPQMLEELKNSGSVTAASIETGTGSTAKGARTWPLLLTLGHRLQRSISRRLKKISLPVSEVQALSTSQSPHQPRADCKFLQVCVEKGPYSTRMHYIDVCDKKTDRDIFRTLKKDYKVIRRELNSLLFKIHRIDFVEFQLYPKELVDSLIPDRLPPPAPDNVEYEYLPMPPQTQPPVPQKLMMHLWHCRDEFAPGDFYSKRFPKKKKQPCKFILDDSPTANLAWGLHMVETLNMSLIIWILFGLTAVSGLIFCISWSLLRNDVSGAFTVSSYITALMTLLIMAVMSVFTRI
ncbi:uncharacterized protein K444DRAFT_707303 [Hyaloscypha bicolor E]|uniref:Uncharacterized protein n=1 Tax=Hyaloscypha bicolor E TaxID=1095630 RepID=A0A2J6SKH9_9HELO|nr:uncharacterized protein K444DRAFT_707303 [Hyaloscypha bicolor E]PMD51257.1 hypothetical protein K444DRAFT_707303 [Hyaloscypha bicolor E]